MLLKLRFVADSNPSLSAIFSIYLDLILGKTNKPSANRGLCFLYLLFTESCAAGGPSRPAHTLLPWNRLPRQPVR
jgi:hypothetical protein